MGAIFNGGSQGSLYCTKVVISTEVSHGRSPCSETDATLASSHLTIFFLRRKFLRVTLTTKLILRRDFQYFLLDLHPCTRLRAIEDEISSSKPREVKVIKKINLITT